MYLVKQILWYYRPDLQIYHTYFYCTKELQIFSHTLAWQLNVRVPKLFSYGGGFCPTLGFHQQNVTTV